MALASWDVVVCVIFYSMSSSILLILNKAAVQRIAAPSSILFCQLAATTIFVELLARSGLAEVDAWCWDKVKPYIIVALTFILSLFCNIRILEHTNVDTFITARSFTPIIVAISDVLFLQRELPSMRSALALFGICLGVTGYFHLDNSLNQPAFAWILGYLSVFTFDQIFIKWICDTIPMTSWGRVLYTNALAAVPALAWALYFEGSVILGVVWDSTAVSVLLLSCACGISLSFFGYRLRSLVSATSFTVVGVTCKLLSIVINTVVWDRHSSKSGLLFLIFAVLSSTFFEQSPKREAQSEKQKVASCA